MSSAEFDQLAQVVRRLEKHQSLYRSYRYASLLCMSIGGISSIIRYRNGWSYEEAGLWVNLGFWGGYLVGLMILIPVIVWGCIDDWSLHKARQEFQKEMTRRGLEARGKSATLVDKGGNTGEKNNT